jgi:type II secretory pathway component PulJ
MKNKKNGFTLLETILYLSLLSFIIGSAFIATFQIIENSHLQSIKIPQEEEVHFVQRKVLWIINNTKLIHVSDTTLSFEKPDENQNIWTLSFENDFLYLQSDLNKEKIALNSNAVPITNGLF